MNKSINELIIKHWAKAGALISIFIIAYIYFIQKNQLPLLEKFILLNLAFLMLHQFEEYVYPGGFKDYFNYNIYNPMGFFRNRLTDKGIIYVNVVLGWGMNIIVFIFLRDYPAAVLIAVTILLFNGLLHLITAFSKQSYNPGVITGAVLFIPLGFYSYYKLSSVNILNTKIIIAVIAVSVLASFLIPITIYLTRPASRH